ncbi:MAG: D-aminoacylase [Imperialibacter sp.]|uniref:N-acyl-D-amino-acid deacylase family protein n=1 Tax=Imperialibacter sp. TaxID=2038411 RepID=UPI0032EB1C7D
MKYLLFGLFTGVTLFAGCQQKMPYDLVILNAQVYDGLGNEPILSDIAVNGDTIAAIGKLKHGGNDTIDASGLAVSPGFIDLHTHIERLLKIPSASSHLKQGVTLTLGGPDGRSPWPFQPYLDSLAQVQLGLNVAYLVGHNTVRSNIMGLEDRQPTPAELTAMKAQINTAMQAGAFGISTGLKYLPGAFSTVDEVIELSKVAASHGGIYTSHLREEGLGLIDGVQEAIQIAQKAKIPVVLTHHKAIGLPMWGASKKTLAMVDSARAIGLDVMMDQYPYTASQTGIAVLIPAWAMEGGIEKYRARLNDKKTRSDIKADVEFNILNDRGGGDLNRVQFGRVTWKPELEGKTLKDWAEMEGLKPTVSTGAELVMKAQENGGASCIFHVISEEDVQRIMQHPMAMVASDGSLVEPGDGHPHPRSYGTFPRVLGHYSRDLGVIPMQEAIRKMTSLPAARLGLTDRGSIAVGNYADLVIFNPETIADKATFENPHQYPEGISYVIVNGVISVKPDGSIKTGAGKVLRKGFPD